MSDLLHRIRQEMTTRVMELRPLIQEHNRLEDALRALNETGNPVTSRAANNKSSNGKPRRARQEQKPPANSRKRAPRGANREAALRVLGDRPGVSSAELAAASGVPRNTLQVLLNRLVKEGVIEQQELPSGRGYALTKTRASETIGSPGSDHPDDEPAGNEVPNEVPNEATPPTSNETEEDSPALTDKPNE